MTSNLPSVFQIVEQTIKSHEGEQGTRNPSGFCYKAKNDWEALPLHSDDWQYILDIEKAAHTILWSLYGKIQINPPYVTVVNEESVPHVVLDHKCSSYPAAQLREQLRSLKQAIQQSFLVAGNNVEFTPYIDKPIDFPLRSLVTSLIGEKSSSGLPTITGHPNCTISMKNAEKIAPLLELNLGRGRVAGS